MQQSMQVLTSEGTNEWYTPPHIIERVRATLGVIELDPASADIPQGWIRADQYHKLVYTPEFSARLATMHTDAERRNAIKVYSRLQLGKQPSWAGLRVFLNPPFDDAEHWIRQLEISRGSSDVPAVALINSNHGYNWYERLYRTYHCALLHERIAFVDHTGKVDPKKQAKRGSTILYLSNDDYNYTQFHRIWRDIARIIPNYVY